MKKLSLMLFVLVALSASAFATTKDQKSQRANSSNFIITKVFRKTPIQVTDNLSCGVKASYSYTPADGMTNAQVLAEISIIHNYLESTYCPPAPTAV